MSRIRLVCRRINFHREGWNASLVAVLPSNICAHRKIVLWLSNIWNPRKLVYRIWNNELICQKLSASMHRRNSKKGGFLSRLKCCCWSFVIACQWLSLRVWSATKRGVDLAMSAEQTVQSQWHTHVDQRRADLPDHVYLLVFGSLLLTLSKTASPTGVNQAISSP